MSLTTRRFAELVGVTPETVRRWIRSGRLTPAGKTPGGQLRFSASQVEQVLSGSTESATRLAEALESHVLAARAKLRARRGA